MRKISILITLFLFIGSIAYYFLMDKIWSPDSFQKIYVLKNTDGKEFLCFLEYYRIVAEDDNHFTKRIPDSYIHRLTVIDPLDGLVAAKTTIGDRIYLGTTRKAHWFFLTNHMLEARDLFSGIVVVDTGRLAELHDGFRSNLQSTIIAGPEQLRVTFDDGTEFLLNEKDVIVGNYFKGDIYPGNSVKPPQFLSWQKEGLRGELLFDKLRKAKDLNFLKPVFLVNKNTSTKTAWDGLGPDAHPVSLLYSQNPEGFFVLHPRSISREENEISMIDFSGRILWTIPFPGIKSQLEDSILSSGYLIIVIKKQFISTILGIDLKNGKVEWSQKL